MNSSPSFWVHLSGQCQKVLVNAISSGMMEGALVGAGVSRMNPSEAFGASCNGIATTALKSFISHFGDGLARLLARRDHIMRGEVTAER